MPKDEWDLVVKIEQQCRGCELSSSCDDRNLECTKKKIPKMHKFLCCNQETYSPLIWRQYGYWYADPHNHKVYPMPEWVTADTYTAIEDLVANLKEPNLKVEIETHQDKTKTSWEASWKIFDENNPHIEPETGRVTGCKSEYGAHEYAMQRYYELKHLYDGDIEALLVYKKTGIACLPNWNTNETDSWGFKVANGKIIKTRVPRAKEVK